MRRLALLLLAVGAEGGVAAAATRYEREILVERPGEVVVDLDGAALLHLGDGGGFELVGPGGERLPVRRRLAAEERRCRAAEVLGVALEGEHYRIEIDPGAWGEPLGALRFELEERTLAPRCRLEGSANGQSFHTLAEETLFRLGEGSTLARTRIDFSPQRLGRFRLFWPAAAGHPAVRAVEACAAGPPAPSPVVPATGFERLPPFAGMSRFRLPTPAAAAPLAAIEVELAPGRGEPSAYRLEHAAGGAWRPLAAGLWPAGGTGHRIELGETAVPSGRLRLELAGEAQEVIVVRWVLAAQRLRFRATQAGSYRLSYPAQPSPAFTGAAEAEAASSAALGAERAVESRRPSPAAGAEPPPVRFAERFAVVAASAPEAGQPVALELPSERIATDAALRGELRLIAAGRQVPFRGELAADPEVLPLAGARDPAPGEKGASFLDFDLPAAGSLGHPGARVRLLAPPHQAPFRRPVRLEPRAPAPGRRGARPGGEWSCAALGALPCATTLDLLGFDEPEARVRFEDGDSAPLSGIALELERPRARLLFLWPGADAPVELVIGAPGLASPRYDLAALDEALALERPAAVRLGEALAALAPPWWERHPKALLVGALVMVATALGALLFRLLPRPADRG